MDLKLVRNEIDKLDNIIKNLLVFRMSLIPLVTRIKIENNIELHQIGREQAIYDNIKEFSDKTGMNNELLKNIYGLIIKNALEIEHMWLSTRIKQTKIEISNEALKEYKKLNEILGKDIPQIINNIQKLLPESKLFDIATGIYERRLQDEF